MKNLLLITSIILLAAGAPAQTQQHKVGISAGGFIQHYNGDLGNSFFQFKTTCFGGGMLSLGYFLNKSFDVMLSGTHGDFGYCQTEADKARIAPVELRCPGCTDRLGMGELRSRMTSVNLSLKYKIANGYLLRHDARVSPFIFAGVGANYLADNMGRQCVTVGTHFTLNGGAGVRYNVNDRLSVGYNLGIGCFLKQKVYATVAEIHQDDDHDAVELPSKRDVYLQNTLTVGINLF